MRVGVDIGGTNTDAAIILGNEVLGAHKTQTRDDFSDSVKSAISEALKNAQAAPADVATVTLGTTQFTNAFTERKRLQRVAILRICLPFSRDIEPMLDWPSDLKYILGSNIYMVRGGFEFDGSEAASLDEIGIRNAARDMRGRGLRHIAVSCIFSTINDAMEIRAGEIIAREIPDAHITLSSRVGRLNLIDRENAALINASLGDLGAAVVESFADALTTLGITAPFFVSQNDSSQIPPEHAARNPVLTYSSGAANSIRGAAHLTQCDNAIAVDIGGTTTDIGVLKKGFPRERSRPQPFGGVRTNFRMPDLLSIGLGGGSIVELGRNLSIGPESVGGELKSKALVYGGDVLTATDIAVAAGRVTLGDPAHLAGIPAKELARADRLIQKIIADAINKMKTTAEDIPVIIVGGGRILAAHELPGGTRLRTPDHAGVANAIGAAIALLSGNAEQIFDYGQTDSTEAIAEMTQRARQQAVAIGADPATLRVIDVEEIPVPYTDGKMTLVRVKVVGDPLMERS